MTNAEQEQWYDTEVAPKLLALSRECREHGLSFLAAVEWNPGKIGLTGAYQPEMCLALELLRYCAHYRENLDGYVLQVLRHCARRGIDTSESLVAHFLKG